MYQLYFRWKLRHESQKKDIEKEQFLFDCINTQRAIFIKKYNEKIEKEQERMDGIEFLPKYYFFFYIMVQTYIYIYI